MARTALTTKQNLLTFSEQADNAVWVNSGTTVSANTTTNPVDGALTADTITAQAGGAFHDWGYANGSGFQTIAPVGGGPFTFSLFVQRNNNDWMAIMPMSNVSGGNTVYFNLATGAFGSTGANAVTNNVSHKLEQVFPNGWYRISVTVPVMPTYSAATAGFGIFMANADGGNNFSAAGTEAVNVFGMQLTQSNFAGPYVQTGSSNVNTAGVRNLNIQNQNLVTWSQDIGNVAWSKTTGITITSNSTDVPDPLSGNTSSKIVYDGSGSVNTVKFQQSTGLTRVAGTQHTMSIWARTLSGTHGFYLQDNNQTGPAFTATSIWQQFTFTNSLTIPALINWNFFEASGDNTAFTVYVWQAQDVFANWPGNFTPTTSSAINIGNIRNITAQQNLLLWSQDFSNVAWTQTLCTITANTSDTLDPFGGNTANILVEDNSNNLHRVTQPAVSTGFNRVYTFSIYAKAGVQTWCALQADSGGTGINYVNLLTGATGTLSGMTVTTKNVGNGWWRIAGTYTLTTGASVYIYPATGNNGFTYQGVAGTKAIYICGAQVFQGNWSGNYVQTTSAIINIGSPRNVVSNRKTP